MNDSHLQANFELFKKKKELLKLCESVLRDIEDLDNHKDLLDLFDQQQKLSYKSLVGEIISKQAEVDSLGSDKKLSKQ